VFHYGGSFWTLSTKCARIGIKVPQTPSWLVAGRLTSSKVRRPREARLESWSTGWLLVSEGRATLLPDRVGLGYLAELISWRGQDLDVLSLASPGLIDRGVSYPLADGQALNSYRRRARKLRELIDHNGINPSAAETYREELGVIDSALRLQQGWAERSAFSPTTISERAPLSAKRSFVRSPPSRWSNPSLDNICGGASSRESPVDTRQRSVGA